MMRRIAKWAADRWPLIRRSTSIAIVRDLLEARSRERQAMAAARLADLEEERAKVRNILDRIVKLEFERDAPARFSLKISFDARAFGMNFCPPQELRFLAKEVGRRVEDEIASSRFIDDARVAERERRRAEAIKSQIFACPPIAPSPPAS